MQKKDITEIRDSSRSPSNAQVPYGSNCVRLSPRDWLIIGIVFLALLFFGPMLWERIEKFTPEPNYRLPYELSSDYWLYNRYCRWASSKYDTLVIGDSVVWGHFVSKDNTLSNHLNKIAGRNQFANMGVDGIHPAALKGLLKYYGRDISNKKVILHFNPLWMSSRKHDLQIDKEFHFNHPRLVPQFIPNIPCYTASYSRRMSAVVERYIPFLNWRSHLRLVYFQGKDPPTWTPDQPTRSASKRELQWVELETSLQWNFFQRSVEMLKARDNTVFVLVGPFNEHMLKGKSIDIYRKLKSEIKIWLQQNNVPYYIPETLPGELYSDASHPLSEGYAMLAKQLFENELFRSSILYSE
jgi:hypothetical protein